MLKIVGLFLGLLGLVVLLGNAFAAIDEKTFDPNTQDWDYETKGLTLRFSGTESYFAPADVSPAMIFIVSTAQRMGATVRFGVDPSGQILYMVKPERSASSGGTGGGVPVDSTKPDEREFAPVSQFWDYSGNGLTLWFSGSESYSAPQDVAMAMVFMVAHAQETGATVRIKVDASGKIVSMEKPEGGKNLEGDANRDGEINALDVVFVINKVLGM